MTSKKAKIETITGEARTIKDLNKNNDPKNFYRIRFQLVEKTKDKDKLIKCIKL